MPIALSCPVSVYAATPPASTRVDRDKIMLCLLTGQERHTFLQTVMHKVQEAQSNIDEAMALKSPSAMYCVVSQVLYQSMVETFPAKVGSMDTDEIKQLRAIKAEWLQKRRNTMMCTHKAFVLGRPRVYMFFPQMAHQHQA